MKLRSLIPRAFCAFLLLSLGASTLPRLLALTRDAAALLPLSYEARRERQLGHWYESLVSLKRALRRSEPVALIPVTHDAEVSVFSNYYLYPVRARLFRGRDEYRNASTDSTRPKTIIAATAERFELVPYDVLRDRELRAGHRVVNEPRLSGPATSFVLPIAASVDGPAPETFVVEATLVNESSSEAEVVVTMPPGGRFSRLRIGPGVRLTYYDFVYQRFGTMQTGWMRVESSQPLRAAFYFANRGRGDATLLPNVNGSATTLPHAPLFRDNKLFLLNPLNAPALATVGSEIIPIPPYGLRSFPISAIPLVHGNVYAFITTRELNGKTDFLWPTR